MAITHTHIMIISNTTGPNNRVNLKSTDTNDFI